MQLSTGLFAASLTFSAGALACAHPAAAFAAHHSVTQLHGGWMAKDANPKHAWIYVSGTNTNNVLIYDLAKFGTPQIGEITTGINGPRGLFLDPAGTLYVANIGSGTVTIYPAGATTPSLTLSQGLIQPASAA